MSPRQTQRFEDMKQEKELARVLAFDVASRYCRANGLSIDRLREQRFEWIAGVAFFLQPSHVKPDGLANDIQTQPLPTLVIKNKDGALVVEQTEYTQKYLVQ